jgi:hypothetical protein
VCQQFLYDDDGDGDDDDDDDDTNMGRSKTLKFCIENPRSRELCLWKLCSNGVYGKM